MLIILREGATAHLHFLHTTIGEKGGHAEASSTLCGTFRCVSVCVCVCVCTRFLPLLVDRTQRVISLVMSCTLGYLYMRLQGVPKFRFHHSYLDSATLVLGSLHMCRKMILRHFSQSLSYRWRAQRWSCGHKAALTSR